MKRSAFLLLVTAFVASGCASMRGVQVGTEPAKTYAIEVTNRRSSTVTISYTGNSVNCNLGTVAHRMTERFVIALSEPGQITVVAKTSSGASAGNYPVTLQPGVTQKITVR